ncbi:hypothetical protein FS749_009087 [Ceratobasidium sp. UAMH 11750]|nr:hypothetical protein FS749_009087 [Ceratobasidium sp. UAMH 11750]
MDYVLPYIPPEIWAEIFSNASTAVLAAFAQASRQFFDLAVPYLWNNVDVIRLLDLLPETFPRGLGQIDTSEIPVPLSLSTGYFDRLSIYGAHVRTLSRIPTPNASESHLEHEHARLATTLATLTEGLLPNITTLTITTTTEGCPDQNLGVTLDWICALVFPARNLTRCSLNLNLYGIPDPPKKQLLRILGTILSNSRRIVYLELNTSYPWSPNERPWACFNSGTVPHYLTTFTVRPHILDSNCLAWMAQMSQLRNLRIRVPDMWQLGAQIPRFQGTVLPVGSFPSLKSLDISIRFGFEELFSQLWSTPIVTNLTELSIENYCSCTNPGIFPMIATGSPSLHQLQLAIVVGGFEICMLAPLRSLPLRVLALSGWLALGANPALAISDFFPALEDLYLQETNASEELSAAFIYLPHLKRLYLPPPNDLMPQMVTLAGLYPTSEEDRRVWRSRCFKLVVDSRWADKAEVLGMDILARSYYV